MIIKEKLFKLFVSIYLIQSLEIMNKKITHYILNGYKQLKTKSILIKYSEPEKTTGPSGVVPSM